MNEGIVVFDATTRPWKRYWFAVPRAVVLRAIDTARPLGSALSVILPNFPELTSRDTVWEFFDDPAKAAEWNPESEQEKS